MKRALAFSACLLVLAFAWFMGNPNLKERIANLTCTDYQNLPATSLSKARGNVALWWQGGSAELLADNCTTYPQKPMAIYLGWHQYLRQS